MVRMDSCSNGDGSPRQFALVKYIPDPLGRFLDSLRAELVAGCRLQSHITVLPPRMLKAPTELLLRELQSRVPDLPVFDIEIGDVEVFTETSVVYLGVKHGEEQIKRMHRELSSPPFDFAEPFEFHPHITLAQEFPPERLDQVRRIAVERWRNWSQPRQFTVETLTFVEKTDDAGWQNLGSFELSTANLLKTG